MGCFPSIITLSWSITSLSLSLHQCLPNSFNIIDQPTSMSATSSTRAPDQIMNPANIAFAEIEEMLDNPPQEAHGNSLAIAITSWVAGVITLLLSYLHSALRNLHDFNADI